MKTKQQEREFAFLTYLTALEAGDTEGVLAFLAQAEADKELETMMLDYHQEDKQTETEKPLVTAFKLKREDSRRWLDRFGTGLVAALLMVFVGAVGIVIGSRSVQTPPSNNNTQSDWIVAASSTPSFDCRAELVLNSNQVVINSGLGIEYLRAEHPMAVGVNNPFLVYPNDGSNQDYNALFEGLNVTIDHSSIELSGEDCAILRTIEVYPEEDASRTCEINIANVRLPMSLSLESWVSPSKYAGDTTMYYSMLAAAMLDNKKFLIEAPTEDGYYPIRASNFEGRLPIDMLQFEGDCSSFPILYNPARIDETSAYVVDAQNTMEVDRFYVTEQRFEHGVMLYIEAINQVWTLHEEINGYQVGMYPASELFIIPEGSYYIITETTPDGLYLPEAEFYSIWSGSFYDMDSHSDIPAREIYGWAIARPRHYLAEYHYELTEEGVSHYIRSYFRETYQINTPNPIVFWKNEHPAPNFTWSVIEN